VANNVELRHFHFTPQSIARTPILQMRFRHDRAR
jgi:hypothetical protein